MIPKQELVLKRSKDNLYFITPYNEMLHNQKTKDILLQQFKLQIDYLAH